MLLELRQAFWQIDAGIERVQLAEIECAAAHLPHAVVISGLRRVGKSTLVAQLAHRRERRISTMSTLRMTAS